jgi:hypothetical protein
MKNFILYDSKKGLENKYFSCSLVELYEFCQTVYVYTERQSSHPSAKIGRAGSTEKQRRAGKN